MQLPKMLRRRTVLLASCCLLLVATHRPLLWALARILIVDQRSGPFDGVVIMGGDRRFEIAASLLREQEGRCALLVAQSPDRLEAMGIVSTSAEFAAGQLAARGVSDGSVERIEGPARDRWDEIQLLATWLESQPGVRLVVLSDRFASRETRLAIDLGASDEVAGRVDVWALPDRRYDESNWWLLRTGIREWVLRSLALAYTWCRGKEPPPPVTWDADEYEQRLLGER